MTNDNATVSAEVPLRGTFISVSISPSCEGLRPSCMVLLMNSFFEAFDLFEVASLIKGEYDSDSNDMCLTEFQYNFHTPPARSFSINGLRLTNVKTSFAAGFGLHHLPILEGEIIA